MDERNTFYHYLERIGVSIFSIDAHLKLSNNDPFIPLKSHEIELNWKILKRDIGEKKVLETLKRQVKKIVNEP